MQPTSPRPRRFRRLVRAFAALAAFAVADARALCPHEVLVLANESSVDSVLVARTFMGLYGIPEQNLVRVDVPADIVDPAGGITPERFTEAIWEPACRAVEERGLGPQILAWAYSTDFPSRVTTDPALSLTGLTFLRNRLPDPMDFLVKGAGYESPLFAGPERAAPAADPSTRTFDRLRASLLDDMPLPAMMLGWTGARGNTTDEVLDALTRGRKGDGARPSEGAFLFATNKNVRSTTRQWEYPAVASALESLGSSVSIVPSFPAEGLAAGLMTGREKLPASALRFTPGAYADHLTSNACVFEDAGQTTACEWIRRGATASAGTVTEPFAYWQKFPSATLFLHQRRGVTMIEAVYLATRCPLQLLPIGDPLASPWAERPAPRIEGAGDGPLAGAVTLRAVCDGGDSPMRFDWFVDGRHAGLGSELRLDTAELPDGRHKIRLVARPRGDLRVPGHADLRFAVDNASAPDAGAGASPEADAAPAAESVAAPAMP